MIQLRKITNYQKDFFDTITSPVNYDVQPGLNLIKNFPGKKIIINERLQEGISIVPERFLPVQHHQAFELGSNVFQLLFDCQPQVYQQNISNSTTDYCVELVSQQCKIVFSNNGYRFENGRDDRTPFINYNSNLNMETEYRDDSKTPRDTIASNFVDEYYPFVRVSNYLRTGKFFSIEVGYYRSACSNGLLFGKKSQLIFRTSYIKTSFGQLEAEVRYHFQQYKNKTLGMANKLWQLLTIYCPMDKMRLITYDIFQKEIIQRKSEERKQFMHELMKLTDKYVSEIGANFNAALNVATDFSKLLVKKNEVSPSTLQNKSTLWLERVLRKKFIPELYFAEIADLENQLIHEPQKVDEAIRIVSTKTNTKIYEN